MSTKIAVLMGGLSAEREVSLVSGAAVATALSGEGFNTVKIDVGTDLWTQLSKAAPDIVFNALHGEWGEDGRVQGILEFFGKPYTHSNVMASALAMDKLRTKYLWQGVGLPTPPFVSLDGANHLLTNKADSFYVGEVLASWAKRYVLFNEEPELNTDKQPVVRISKTNYSTNCSST